MRKGLISLSLLAMALLMLVPEAAQAVQAEVRLAPIQRRYAPPPLGRKQGWLTITNYDWRDWSVSISKKGDLYVNEAGYGGTLVRSGTSVSISLEKDDWNIRGADGKVKVKVREGRTSNLDLRPYGYVGNTGLRATTNDGSKVRDEVIYDNRRTVVVQRPGPAPVIVAPPPPPVVINRPPVIINQPPRRPPPPPYRPRPPHRNDGWGFTFGYNHR